MTTTIDADDGGTRAYELGEVHSGRVGGRRCEEKAWDHDGEGGGVIVLWVSDEGGDAVMEDAIDCGGCSRGRRWQGVRVNVIKVGRVRRIGGKKGGVELDHF